MRGDEYLTEGGKKSYQQAVEYNLTEFYTKYTAVYSIPEQDINADYQLKETVLELLKNGLCFTKEGELDQEHKLALTIETHVNEEGELVFGSYDYVIAPAEVDL